MKKNFAGAEMEYRVLPPSGKGVSTLAMGVFEKSAAADLGALSISEFVQKGDFSNPLPSSDGIRTPNGYKLCTDPPCVEIASVPIKIKSGFSSEIVHNILDAEDRLLKNSPSLLSRHSIQVTLNDDFPPGQAEDLASILSPVMDFFVGNPSSNRKAYSRIKSDNKFLELRGDGVPLDQLQAALLLIQGSKKKLREGPPPFQIPQINRTLDGTTNLNKLKSRLSCVETNQNQPVPVTDYLRELCAWTRPAVEELGSKGELENLNLYLSGQKPVLLDEPLQKRVIVEKSEIPITLPEENRLLGAYVRSHNEGKIELKRLSWEEATYTDGLGKQKTVRGVQAIYNHGKTLLDKLG